MEDKLLPIILLGYALEPTNKAGAGAWSSLGLLLALFTQVPIEVEAPYYYLPVLTVMVGLIYLHSPRNQSPPIDVLGNSEGTRVEKEGRP
jgi:hypothetical protein